MPTFSSKPLSEKIGEKVREEGLRAQSNETFSIAVLEYSEGSCTTPSCSAFGKKCPVKPEAETQSDKKHVAKLFVHDNWVKYFRTTSRRSLQGADGRAQVLRAIQRATIHKSY